ncbi:MAG: hypothetical protein XU14_C0025G0004 [Armatimonadetes bacterium CSP1-3]|nr:MAG: hypothetical protein XU14_C0025G0004 [Armatimonadetes bacterium CSP1-3]
MSREGLVHFITRAMEDEGFRAEVKANPDAALAQFDLTVEEVAAIKSGDRSKLQDLGIDERVSKIASAESLVTGFSVASTTPSESILGWLVTLFKTTTTP